MLRPHRRHRAPPRARKGPRHRLRAAKRPDRGGVQREVRGGRARKPVDELQERVAALGELAPREAVRPEREPDGDVGVADVFEEEVELEILDLRVPRQCLWGVSGATETWVT